jgi:hypothetical protein
MGFIQDVVRFAKSAIKQIDKLIDKAGGIQHVFDDLKFDLPDMPNFGGLFDGFNFDMPSMPEIGGGGSAAKAGSAAESSINGMSNALETLRSISVKIGDAFSYMWDRATDFLSGITVEDLVRSFNQAIFATMAFNLIRMVNAITKAFKAFSDIGDGVGDVLSGTGSALKSFQTQAIAKVIINIAIAIAVLAASLWLLSLIPAKKLAKALAAMAGLLVILKVAMSQFSQTVGTLTRQGATANTLAFAVAIVAMALAILLLSTALLIMNKVDWTSLVKGLGTLVVTMKAVERLGSIAEGSGKQMIAGAFAIAIIAGAMIVLAGALLLFKLVDWKSMGKAGAALAGVALAVGLLALIPYEGIAKVGLAMLAAAVGMLAIANALIIFGLVEWASIGKAAVMLALLTASLAILMAVGGPVAASSMLALAGSMVALALACLIFNNVEWASIGKAAAVLTLLIVALAAGAAILAVFLYVIAPVAPVLTTVAAAFALLGLGFLAFAAAMALAISLGTAAVGAFAVIATGAAVAIGVFLQTLAQQAPIMRESALTILQEFINTIVEAVPMIIDGIQRMFDAITKELSNGDKKKTFGDIAREWFDKLYNAAREYIPKLNRLGVEITLRFLQTLANKTDKFADIGTQFVVGLMEGIGNRHEAIIQAAVDLVKQFIDGFVDNIDELTDAGVDGIATFLHDLADSIREGSSKIGSGITDVVDAFKEVGKDMIEGLAEGVTSVNIQEVIEDLARKLPGWARKLLDINSPSKVFMKIGEFISEGLTQGIQKRAGSAIVAVASMITGAIAIADEYTSRYFQKLDQQAIAARARAQGLADAARKAQKSAQKTKSKEDDKAANDLAKEAKKADKKADEEEKQAKKARAAKHSGKSGRTQMLRLVLKSAPTRLRVSLLRQRLRSVTLRRRVSKPKP